ncbi:MAG: hypothetical protein HYT87_19270 [Nitrospirae bacterium]|nr:hypothetical protein [Nitrospirota bacterium]
MKRIISMAWAAFFMSAGLALAGEKVTLQGEVLDSACYIAHGEKGKAHEKCAKMCLRKGAPAALLTDDQKVILLITKHGGEALYEELRKLGGERIEAVGEKFDKGGMVALELESIKSLQSASPAKEKHEESGHGGGHMH